MNPNTSNSIVSMFRSMTTILWFIVFFISTAILSYYRVFPVDGKMLVYPHQMADCALSILNNFAGPITVTVVYYLSVFYYVKPSSDRPKANLSTLAGLAFVASFFSCAYFIFALVTPIFVGVDPASNNDNFVDILNEVGLFGGIINTMFIAPLLAILYAASD